VSQQTLQPNDSSPENPSMSANVGLNCTHEHLNGIAFFCSNAHQFNSCALLYYCFGPNVQFAQCNRNYEQKNLQHSNTTKTYKRFIVLVFIF